MSDYGLVVNAGSSSLKFSVFQRPELSGWRIDVSGQVSGIGTSPRLAAHEADGEEIVDKPLDAGVSDPKAAINVLANFLREHYRGVPVLGVAHRVVHGGPRHSQPCIVTPEVMDELRALIPLAPLHQPYNIAAIEATSARYPGMRQVACFDTGFHSTQPTLARLVPLPKVIRDAGVQRYGFHGLSYEYIASVLPEVAPEIAEGRVIVAHLGSGASLCAMKGRKSVDSTLGFTALDGLCMGTRPGSVDPGVVLHLFQTLGLSAKEVETILYKKSGLLGISGISNDMRALEASSDPRAGLAIDYFVYQAAKHVGALAAVLGGVDALVFTAGIGEHSAAIRRRICEASAWLGVALDEAANEGHGPRISAAGSRVSAWVIPTNEELMIARHTGPLLGIAGVAPAGALTGA